MFLYCNPLCNYFLTLHIQLFDSVGKSICMIGEGRLDPQDVAVSLRGNIVVSDPAHKRLEVFSPRGLYFGPV